MNNPKGAPPLDGERASLMLCWRVTPSRKAAYERAAGGQAVCRWAYRVLDGAAKYKQKGKPGESVNKQSPGARALKSAK